MKFSKKEKTMLVVFLALLYIFVLYNYVLKPSIPKIQDMKAQISDAQARLDQLNEDYNNLPSYKQEIEINKVTDQRLGEYLMNDANLADSIEFVDSLAKTMDSKFSEIVLSAPKEVKEDTYTCYVFPVEFELVCTYDELNEIIKFCEGGSKKVKVTGLEIAVPVSEDMQKSPDQEMQQLGNNTSNKQDDLNIKMGISFFSLNKDDADGIYNYSRSRFKEYNSYDGKPIFIEEEDALPDIIEEVNADEDSSEFTQDTADFVVMARGILNAGDNFLTYSHFNSSRRIQQPLSRKMNVELSLNDQTYKITTTDDRGIVKTVSGNVADRDYTFYMESLINDDTPEDKDMFVDVKIINDSSHSVYVKVNQTGNRLKLMDRSGNIISVKSDGEKVVRI